MSIAFPASASTLLDRLAWFYGDSLFRVSDVLNDLGEDERDVVRVVRPEWANGRGFLQLPLEIVEEAMERIEPDDDEFAKPRLFGEAVDRYKFVKGFRDWATLSHAGSVAAAFLYEDRDRLDRIERELRASELLVSTIAKRVGMCDSTCGQLVDKLFNNGLVDREVVEGWDHVRAFYWWDSDIQIKPLLDYYERVESVVFKVGIGGRNRKGLRKIQKGDSEQ